jgi:NADPH:quinone reductase-like Zn-dependent oxidoreductase
MRAFQIEAFGIEGLRAVEREDPVPGPGQILVRTRAVSLNYRDLMTVEGRYNPKLRMPRVPCSDACGEVVTVGEGVTEFKPGDRVASCLVQDWPEGEITESRARTTLGGDLDGTLAELVVLKERGAVHVPQHLSDEEAAALPCAAVTAWNALMHGAGLKPGSTVLVQGTGGVSIFALQFAKLAGARVIVTSSSDEKLERARALGADDGINYREVPEWDRRVRELTGGVGVDHVVEVGGAGTLPLSMRAVRMGGEISVIGVLAGAGEVNPIPILMRSLRLRGIFVGSRALFQEMNRVIALHGLRPVVDRVFPVEEVRDALRFMESGGHFGKICLRF